MAFKFRNIRTRVLLLIIFINCLCFVNLTSAAERDPFVSAIDEQQVARSKEGYEHMDISQVKLRGIIWNELRPVAILNEGDLVMPHDTWKQFKVESIDKGSITLSESGKNYKLYVNGTQKVEKQLATHTAKAYEQDSSPKGETVFIQKALIDGQEN